MKKRDLVCTYCCWKNNHVANKDRNFCVMKNTFVVALRNVDSHTLKSIKLSLHRLSDNNRIADDALSSVLILVEKVVMLPYFKSNTICHQGARFLVNMTSCQRMYILSLLQFQCYFILYIKWHFCCILKRLYTTYMLYLICWQSDRESEVIFLIFHFFKLCLFFFHNRGQPWT